MLHLRVGIVRVISHLRCHHVWVVREVNLNWSTAAHVLEVVADDYIRFSVVVVLFTFLVSSRTPVANVDRATAEDQEEPSPIESAVTVTAVVTIVVVIITVTVVVRGVKKLGVKVEDISIFHSFIRVGGISILRSVIVQPIIGVVPDVALG